MLYMNGALSGSIAVANFPLPRSFIGAAYAAGSHIDYLLGSLDEMLVFNRALQGTELSAIFSTGAAGLCRAPEFTGIAPDGGGEIELGLRGQTGKNFTLYASANLMDWTPSVTIENPSGTVQYTNFISPAPQFYFRISQP